VEKRRAVLEQYQYGKGKTSQQIGLLFIEQALACAQPDGIVAIIIPTGYLTNQSEAFMREDLLKNHRILGVFYLPDGTFKRSGTGVDTSLLIITRRTPQRARFSWIRMELRRKIIRSPKLLSGF
jgi:type I restriction-modification system DNA methylase subunit